MIKIIETDRLILKVLDDSYGKVILDYFIRNKDFALEFEPKRENSFFSLENMVFILKSEMSYIENKSMLKYWIFKKENEDKVIGFVNFYNIVPYAFQGCHVGYRLDKEEVNNGFISEALQKSIEIIFNEYGMHRIEANVVKENTTSLRVLEKLGFKKEGYSYKFLKVNNEWTDHIRMSLLN